MNTLFHLNTPTPLLLCFDLKVNKNIKHLRDCKRELFATSTVITMYLPALWVSTIKKCFLFCDIRATMFLQYVIMPDGRLPENFWP